MKLRKYIEMGETMAGSQVRLAKYLGMNAATLRKSKNDMQGMPDPLCIKLAKLIDEDPLKVIAASNLVTEKNPERIEILKSCLSKAAMILFALNISLIPNISEANSILHKSNTTQNIVPFYTLYAISRLTKSINQLFFDKLNRRR